MRTVNERISLPTKKRKSKKKITIDQIKQQIDGFGLKTGDSVLVHSAFSCISAKPEDVIQMFLDEIGPSGTLLMPTHPKLNHEGELWCYDIKKSPSYVGYLTEYFRNMPDVKRSKHPYASVATLGSKSDYYLENNVNAQCPLPHGIYSSYWKFSLDKGKVICIGVTAIGRATIKHVAEEVLEDRFPLKNIFEKNKVLIKNNDQILGEYIVRKRTDDLIKYLAKSRLERDWIKNDIVLKKIVEGVPVEYMDANRCVQWMLSKAQNGYTMYPYAKYRKKYRERMSQE